MDLLSQIRGYLKNKTNELKKNITISNENIQKKQQEQVKSQKNDASNKNLNLMSGQFFNSFDFTNSNNSKTQVSKLSEADLSSINQKLSYLDEYLQNISDNRTKLDYFENQIDNYGVSESDFWEDLNNYVDEMMRKANYYSNVEAEDFEKSVFSPEEKAKQTEFNTNTELEFTDKATEQSENASKYFTVDSYKQTIGVLNNSNKDLTFQEMVDNSNSAIDNIESEIGTLSKSEKKHIAIEKYYNSSDSKIKNEIIEIRKIEEKYDMNFYDEFYDFNTSFKDNEYYEQVGKRVNEINSKIEGGLSDSEKESVAKIIKIFGDISVPSVQEAHDAIKTLEDDYGYKFDDDELEFIFSGKTNANCSYQSNASNKFIIDRFSFIKELEDKYGDLDFRNKRAIYYGNDNAIRNQLAQIDSIKKEIGELSADEKNFIINSGYSISDKTEAIKTMREAQEKIGDFNFINSNFTYNNLMIKGNKEQVLNGIDNGLQAIEILENNGQELTYDNKQQIINNAIYFGESAEKTIGRFSNGNMNWYEPIVFDLAGDGIQNLSMKEGVEFDFDGKGAKEKVSFIQGDDAFLTLDKNSNGQIDNGKELFGDASGAKEGFAELSKYDSNKDNLIDKNDAVYANLRLWQDLNRNGISEEKELTTLQERGIESITLNAQDIDETDSLGNKAIKKSVFTKTDGTTGVAADVYFLGKK